MNTISRSVLGAVSKAKLLQRSQSSVYAIRTMSSQPQFSTNHDPVQGEKDLAPLLRGNGGKWRIIESGKGLERPFKFKGFKKCWEFMNTVADECVKQKHHPEWSNVYNTTFIRWTTHSPPGLSEKDILMAKFCDEAAQKCGEVGIKVEDELEGGVGEQLVDKVAVEAGDCCIPKSKK